ncbi:MAG: DUF3015 family protein [Arcobacter sp.]|jgi:hypothetical protein|uniref:DUF3015 family protein n=1 Tax=unclassified Arcobacter TaxID=2593671 RepID=UPI0002296175|nr:MULTISPECIES: DUF3015 family protein [unclassified Arcobacter]MDY3199802.1 DUF3015 family protein [Arcobacter sp.]BAK72399.1 conserved hypothetical protein [Arcobacter sp. L]
MKKIIGLIAALGLTASVYANENTGCGLGSLVIKNQNTVVLQVLAATTNGTSGSQTFGITSGTSNCDKPSNFVSNDKLNKFVAENMDELALDISAGHGETLQTVAKLMNVENTDAFSAKLQANFSNIYSNQDVTSANVIDSIAKYM